MQFVAITSAALLLSAPLALAQVQTVLTEDFETGQFPPPGWSQEVLNPSSVTFWALNTVQTSGYPDSGFGLYSGFHDYGPAGTTDDNVLASPSLDLGGLAQVWLHFFEFITFPTYRWNHWIAVSTDGYSWTNVYDSLAPGYLKVFTDVDLSAYAGMSGVRLGFHYYGSDASGWYVDEIVVNDESTTPPPPPVTWTVNVPTVFSPAKGFTEGFEAGAGTVPSYAAVTEVDALTLAPDPEAWANVGQHGPCTGGSSNHLPRTGSYCLELGLDPSATNYHDVRNALVFALDGQREEGLLLSFWITDHGEEDDAIDGVWLSADGTHWHVLYDGWSQHGAAWEHISQLELDQTPVNTSRKFYLMFAAEDDFPLGSSDGVQIDDIVVSGRPQIRVTNLVAGSTTTLELEDFTPNTLAYFVWSQKPGPTSTIYGEAQVGLPWVQYVFPIDGTGRYATTFPINAALQGEDVYAQGYDVPAALFSNALAEIIG